MKGIVFNLLENFITEVAGDEVFEDVLDSCHFKTQDPFVGPGTYPDEDFIEMVVQTCSKLGITPEEAQRKFGQYCFSKLISYHPAFVGKDMTIKEFLLSVENIIHAEVKKLFPGAVVPTFSYNDVAADELEITYESPRNLCFFMEGLLYGCSQYFNTPLNQEQVTCVHRGDKQCVFHLKFY